MTGLISVRTIEILREERTKLLETVAHIDAIIEANGHAPVPDKRQKRHDQPTGRRPGRKARYDWAMGRTLWEKDGAEVKGMAEVLQGTKGGGKGAQKRYGWAPRGSLSATKTPEQEPVVPYQLTEALVEQATERRVSPPKPKPRAYQPTRGKPPSVTSYSSNRVSVIWNVTPRRSPRNGRSAAKDIPPIESTVQVISSERADPTEKTQIRARPRNGTLRGSDSISSTISSIESSRPSTLAGSGMVTSTMLPFSSRR